MSDSESKHSEPQYSDEVPTFLKAKGDKLNKIITTMCGVGFFLFGYDQGVMGSLLTLPTFRARFPEMDTVSNEELSYAIHQGLVIGLYAVGCLVGALATMYIGDKFGRVKMIFWGCVIIVIGGILQAAATNTDFLVTARVISGVGNGLLTATVPLYAAECSKANSRGKSLCIHGSLITLGIAVSYWIDFAFYFTEQFGEVSWRFPIAFQLIFPVGICCFGTTFPESPRWLMGQSRREEAAKVFAALYDKPPSSAYVQSLCDDIAKSLDAEIKAGGNKFSVKNLLKQGPRKNFQRVNLAGWSQVMQQICGINLITYYAGTIFEEYIGMDALESRILAACNGTEYFLASLIPIFVIEKFGRRKLFLFGTAGQCLSMLLLYVCMEIAEQGNDGGSIGAAVMLFAFNSFFGMSLLSLTWLYPPEVSSLEVRAPTTAISTACNWGFNFLVVMITPICFNSIDHHTYLIFFGINFCMVPVFYFLYPETRGRTLEEMDLIFADTPVWKPWKSVGIAATMPFLEETKDIESFNQKADAEHYSNGSSSSPESDSGLMEDTKSETKFVENVNKENSISRV
ncbi:hypothetical protein FT663_04864 [Candidozyma haemuli var. vulneris]|uniref:Major facilitator superfamily (MFS) profile domain-containing protein n=1 Tax=Candidozyma haemuli TaxID=45357 RepID=A0A2V1AMZ1_9ASCO|nr:hypothetical protein CXQ85_001218 [[Candida] haemuloni]KAF3986486.1 hypothetical protein FT663_04864 [[Candida] haemuloni var. vulneris]KAF3991884.1 hypothetical protein FT662_01501 [[Candida] haemuloni var. vulneris]PVH18926.1 hypothetical protein CXQ85_001218 [[Candida] haemuloni]